MLGEKFLSSSTTGSFSRRAHLHVVSVKQVGGRGAVAKSLQWHMGYEMMLHANSFFN
jgi:hypothetical protein